MEKEQIYIALGSNIQRLRKEVGMTQAQMAEKISRSEDAVSNIERGTSAPPPETALAISKTLGVKLSDLYDFKFEDDPTPDDVRDYLRKLRESLEKMDEKERLKLYSLISGMVELID